MVRRKRTEEFRTKRELVSHLKSTLETTAFIVFCCSCVDEAMYEELKDKDETIRQYVHDYWRLPNLDTIHVYST